ncbi:hypothetical protein PUW24_14745 [Paenibacillus urinalis]|uniref:Uncharacterized protein n=1 Tax=Paenibacillus urinalis TaxID=521520 RepID=A0ABY7XGK5_9BACL|nr:MULTISPECIES: hypothetical protein [Paenibacillus]WDH95474.1 hypothetical protein PUW24_14745 [Paenibacillus urinalis]WDI03672.1 hypothetical protein PUW25_06870 [Paenibacillus urinalis]GAK38996.1 hypothetical protein TCA2_0722 [Paenibacillus sp. TCA20]
MKKKILSFFLVFSLVTTMFGTAFATERVDSSDTSQSWTTFFVEENAQEIIEGLYENHAGSLTSIPVNSEEEANRIIERIERLEPVTVEVYRDSTYSNVDTSESLEVSPFQTQVAKVSATPTYIFDKISSNKGEIYVYLDINVTGGGIETSISRAKGYAGAGTNVGSVRMDINKWNIPPMRNLHVAVHDEILINFVSDNIQVEGYVEVYLLGGWNNADLFFDWESDF